MSWKFQMMQFPLAMVMCGLFPYGAWADTQTGMMTITAECTTKETGPDGVRHQCRSRDVRLSAPKGHVFVQNSLTGGELSGSGSSYGCYFEWADFVEVIPGTHITQPSGLHLYARAVGPKGYSSGRGWAKCEYSVPVVKY